MSEEDKPLHVPEQWREIGPRAFPVRSQEVLRWIQAQEGTWLAALTRRRIEGGRDAPLTADELLNETFLDLLDRLRIGVLVMDSDLRTYFSNQLLRELVAEVPGLALADERLQIAQARIKTSLLREVHRVTGSDGQPGVSGAALRIGGASELLLYLMPAFEPPSGVPAGPLVFLFAARGDRRAPIRPIDIEVWFGLTSAEAALAAAFVHGEPLKRYAERRRLSINTVRNQFASLRGKLGADSQADVVRTVLLGSPLIVFSVDPR